MIPPHEHAWSVGLSNEVAHPLLIHGSTTMKTQTLLVNSLVATWLVVTFLFGPGLIATAEADIVVSSDTTWSETYAHSQDIHVTSGATLTLSANGSGTTGNWYVNDSTITSTYANTSKVTPDYSFGTGTLYLTNSSLSAGVHRMNVSAPVVVSGNCKFTGGTREIYLHGNISGSGTITEDLGWSIYLRGDNSAYTGDWILKNDYTWIYNSSATAQTSWASGGSARGDYTFGSGTITVDGGMFALGVSNAYIYNDIVLNSAGAVFAKEGASLTLLGNLSGSGTFNATSASSYSSTKLYNLRGNNSDFTGTWNLQSADVSTDNTSAVKVTNSSGNAADSRFGTGTITLNGGGIQADRNGTDGTSIYVHNNLTIGANGGKFKAAPGVTLNLTGPILASGAILNTSAETLKISGSLTSSSIVGNTSTGTIEITGPLTPQTGFTLGSTGTGKILISSNLTANTPITVTGSNTITLNGALTGSSNITVSGGRFRVLGTTTGYSGDWHVNGGKVVVNGANAPGTSFGTGTVYLEGNDAAIVGFSSSQSGWADAYVYNPIVVTGKNYLRSDGDPETVGGKNANYQVTLRGPISSTNSVVTAADTNAMLIREGGGFRWDISGDNSGYQGNWLIKSDYLQTNNTTSTAGNSAATHTDARFGSGTIYMQGGGIQNGGVVYNDITVQTGNTGNFRNIDFSLYGTVTADGTLATTTANSDELHIYGTLQGKGTVANAKVTVENGGILAPGQLGVVYYTEASHTYTQLADDLTGTLPLNGGLAVNAGGVLSFDLLSDTDYDTIVVNESSVTYSGTTYSFSDDIDLANATIRLTFGEDFDWEHCSLNALLIDTEGMVTGLDSATIEYILEPGAAAVTSLPANLLATLSVTSSGVVLTLQNVPEPASIVLWLVSTVGLFWYRRRL